MSGSTASDKPGLSIDTTEFRQGWRILLLAMVGTLTSVSVAPLYTFGTMVVPLQQAFGWEREQIQPALGVLFATAVVAVPFAGWMIRRYGLRPVTLASLLALPVGYVVMTLNQGAIWQLYAGFIILGVAGMGTTHVTWTQLVSLWFEKNRGLALAFILCGSGLAALVLPNAVTWAMVHWGWRAGFWMLGILPVVLTLPLAWCWLDPQSPAVLLRADQAVMAFGQRQLELPGMTLREIGRSPRFWLCNLALSMFIAAMIALLTNTVPMLRDRGLSAASAAEAFSVYGVSLVFGRVGVGYLVDRLWAPAVAFVVMLMPALGCVLFLSAGIHIQSLMLASLLVGLGAGAEMDIAAYLISRYFGMREYSRAFSLHMGVISLVSMVTPLFFATLYAHNSSYRPMLLVCMGFTGFSALLLLAMGRYPDFGRVLAPGTAGGAA